VESEVERPGGCAVIFNDQLGQCGSRRVYRPIHALGLAEITRHPKRYVCKLADGWREVRTMRDALIASHEITTSSIRI
jgi:hypothetical protein